MQEAHSGGSMKGELGRVRLKVGRTVRWLMNFSGKIMVNVLNWGSDRKMKEDR